jgi:hypothetical protein
VLKLFLGLLLALLSQQQLGLGVMAARRKQQIQQRVKAEQQVALHLLAHI